MPSKENNLGLHNDIKSFLYPPLPPKGTLLLTTFGLDEIVLVELLKTARLDSRYRIVVFHDIIKRLNPGYLKIAYPNSKVIGIRLPSSKGISCPVFHSKVWVILSSRRRISRVAVHSINLTRYHLSDPARTVESFWYRKKLDLTLPPSPIFRSLYKGLNQSRLRIPPETWIINETVDGRVTIRCSRQSAGDEIKKHLLDFPATLQAGAPFISTRVLQDLGINPELVPIKCGFIEKRGRTISLHAKLILQNRAVLAGSPNLTAQAMRISQNPVNHETVLILKRSGRPLEKAMHSFPKLDIADDVTETPGDDPDLFGEDWEKERRLADNGPNSIQLELVPKEKIAQIRLVGKLSGAHVICLHWDPSGVKETSNHLVLVARRGRIRVPKKKQPHLVELVLRPPVIVEGKRNSSSKPIWRRELDLGDLWRELTHGSIKEGRSSSEGSTERGSKNQNQSHKIFEDVREIRDYILAHDARNIKWLWWILRFQSTKPSLQNIPTWIQILRKERQRNA
ncbi:MAG: hypothetical protein JW902_01975 [Syntrophaceae bacterium]|nr:hypothetical protein [Syntrophaceae bacterium]